MVRKVGSKIILIINILLAISLLISYTAPFINPSRLLFPAFFGLAYPYLLLLNLIFFFYWIIRMKKELLISLVVILLGWGHLTNFVPIRFQKSDQDQPVSERSLSIMSYNVRTFDKYKWTRKSDSEEGIFKTIGDEAPSVLCIQEFLSESKPGKRERDIRKKLNEFPYYTIYYSLSTGPSSGFGIATFSKYPIIRTNRIPFDNTVNQAVLTDVRIGSDTIRIFNIHLQSIRFARRNYAFLDSLSFKDTNRQIEEMKDISIRLREAFVMRAEQSIILHHYIQNSPYPVIVAGDFNDTPVSFSYRKIRKGLQDAFRISGRGFGNTYAGDLPSFRIDYIFYSEELDSFRFERIKSKFSDHFPIVANLRIMEEKETD